MMVRIRYKTGTVRNVPAYVGKRLVERRIAEYYDEQPPATVVEAAPVVEQAVDLDGLTRDELYSLAVERGFAPHPQLGAAKLKALLR